MTLFFAEAERAAKPCPRCGETKAASEFYVRKDKRYLHSWCKSCDHEHNAARARQRRKEGRPYGDKARNRDLGLARRFGIDSSQYEDMLVAQCGACAVCGRLEHVTDPRTDQPPRLSVHHDHLTGAVIALLCRACNRGMGSLRDDPALMRRAASVHERR